MKIDIITRHATTNYGSLLQTYATQKVLKKLGHDSEIINYVKYEERGKNKAKTFLKRSATWNKNIITRILYKIIQTPNHIIMYNKFEKFRKKLLKQTKEYGSFEELKLDCPEADVYCTGSDQVWGKIGTDEFDKNYFLEFVKKGKKCIAYSASFGNEKIVESLEKELPSLIKKYDTLLVREESAVKIIKEVAKRDSKLVLDPTLLLTQKEWKDMLVENKEKKKYVLVYQLHDNKKFDRYAKEFAKNKKMKLIRVSPSAHNIFKSGKLKWLPTPNEFLTYFANAEYILTDSFHATVFALIFDKKFIDILPNTTGTRIINVLNIAGLDDRILKDYSDFATIDNKINFNDVHQRIEAEKDKSIELLKKAIEEKVL